MSKKILFPILAIAFISFTTTLSSGADNVTPQRDTQTVTQEAEKKLTPQEAAVYFHQQAETGQAQAMYNLGIFYENGFGVPRNLTTALQWYQKAAEAGVAQGFYQAGMAYQSGRGTVANRQAAIEHLEQAASHKHLEAAYELAALNITSTPREGDVPKAIKYLTDTGISEAKAMELIGTMYENGQGVPRNFSTAFEWYQKAGNAGQAEGFMRQGKCYELGLGVASSPLEAIACFQKAADLNLAEADFKLAKINLAGILKEVDNAKAVEYLIKATANGHKEAANDLGVIYLEGSLDQPKDQDKALEMFLKSASLGHPIAMKNVAVIYKDGIGRKADQSLALKWYLIAKEFGYQPESYDEIIEQVKKDLKQDKIKKIEDEAQKWVQDFKKS